MIQRFDKKELKVMSLLRRNARETLTKLSKKTNIPISTIYEKIKHHNNSIIRKHTCIIDFAKLGFGTRVSISLKVSKKRRDELREYLKTHPNVNTIYKINNGFDYWVECIFRNIKDLELFIEHLEEKFKVRNQVYFIIDEIKREAFMSDPDLIDLITQEDQ